MAFGCLLSQPCPEGSKLCYVGSCSLGEGPDAGVPQIDTFDHCAANLVSPDGKSEIVRWDDAWFFCIPPEASAADYRCALIEVLEDD